MGISATVKLKMLFLEEQKDRALKLFRWLAATNDKLLDISNDDWGGVGELSFQRLLLKGTGADFDPTVYIVSLTHKDDRNFWVERYGLKRIIKNVIDQTEDDSDNDDWSGRYFAAKLRCVIEMENFNVDSLEYGKNIVDAFGETWHEELNKGTIINLPDKELDVTWNNPEYGKKSFEEIVAEHYSEYFLKMTAVGVGQ